MMLKNSKIEVKKKLHQLVGSVAVYKAQQFLDFL